jgi:hypothetical protein
VRGKQNGQWPPLVTSRHRDKEASPRAAATTGVHRSRSTLHVVSAVTGTRAVRDTG